MFKVNSHLMLLTLTRNNVQCVLLHIIHALKSLLTFIFLGILKLSCESSPKATHFVYSACFCYPSMFRKKGCITLMLFEDRTSGCGHIFVLLNKQIQVVCEESSTNQLSYVITLVVSFTTCPFLNTCRQFPCLFHYYLPHLFTVKKFSQSYVALVFLGIIKLLYDFWIS